MKSKIWTPGKIGVIAAEREFTFKARGKKATIIRVLFGVPVRKKHPEKNEPWICTTVIKGFQPEFKTFVFGIDSLQAFTLALDLVNTVLPSMGRGNGGEIEFLDPNAPLIFNDWPMGMAKKMDQKIGRFKSKRESDQEKLESKPDKKSTSKK
jgi:hypothetical protein